MFHLTITNEFWNFQGIKSERLLQLLLNDEQFTSAIVMSTYREIVLAKKSILRQLDDKTLFYILDEVVYKLATSDLTEIGK